MSLILRPMESRDVPMVAAIDRLSFPTPWPAGAFHRELKRDGANYSVLLRHDQEPSEASDGRLGTWLQRVFGPSTSDSVIGYVGFRLQDSTGHITTIAVHPAWRGRGLGDLLLSVALVKMVKRGITMTTLEMRPSNSVALRLYQKYGFRIVQSRRRYYRDGEDAWVMAASIGDRGYLQRLTELRAAVEERLHRQRIEVGQMNA